MENKQWSEAAHLQVTPADFPWKKFPWQAAIIHFTRALGSAHIGNLQAAKEELNQLLGFRQSLMEQKDAYKTNQVAIQIKTIEAWLRLKEGKNQEALTRMQQAADMEDKTEKHPVTPGEVLPVRELLADMLLQLHKPTEALGAYETDLKKYPNRLNALYGAGVAAKSIGDVQKANAYFQQLTKVAGSAASTRTEVTNSKQFLKTLASR